ncbi:MULTISPECIES: hypothetical protein [Pseudomonas]|uniref:hypothetical protein n=1 Tax=Pseudomonas TaxID=286 RepID=UPI001CE3D73D|nr:MULTISPECIES: hypothetical protein [Pseudomonas]MCO7597417.1 hypothetical protein [Pseudomonas guariconensis]MCU7222711.1 hypothetical protein [Pseudomonas brassicacearum]
MSQQESTSPTWWTVGLFTLIFSVASSLITATVKFVEIKGDLSVSTNKVQALEKSNAQLRGYIEQWRTANDRLQAQLGATSSRLHALENDRCIPLRDEVNDISHTIQNAEKWGYSLSRIAALRELSHEYQETLRACYGSKT